MLMPVEIVADPYGASKPIPPETRIRFRFYKDAHIDVFVRSGALVIHGDGFSGHLVVRPNVANEIEVRLDC